MTTTFFWITITSTNLPMRTGLISYRMTDRQKEIFTEQFRRYTKSMIQRFTPFRGSLPAELVDVDKPRKPFSMITASRLAQEKHIDWLVSGDLRSS